ncbi:uncharacterized protein cv-d [Plodia interpunctella]|uniref:uncharacterized protein cv-d n=1 Tax=Plodia interpunctella TaxID=58824 RepID=UPI0023675B84|nr:uncharacterized protein LOC128682484 [Plodia interpunctella]XP_053623162.1 uncharacterized protein LOC128682484 [Plodia interpunctella]
MLLQAVLLFIVASTSAMSTGLQLLFPAHRLYIFLFKTTVSTGLETSETYWTLDGKLSVVVGSNFTKARFQLEDLEVSAYSDGNNLYNKSSEAEKRLLEPWEADYYESGSIDSIYLGSEPVWAQNIKRALSLNFQVIKKTGTYKISEPCLYHLCHVVYTTRGNSIKKYTNQRIVSGQTEYYWSTVPTALNYMGRGYPESMALSERVYEIDDVKGLLSLELKGSFQYKISDSLLSTVTSLSLYYESHRPIPEQVELDLNQSSITYVTSDSSNPSNGIREHSQDYLKNKTYGILLKIATKGIDADNIVRNATFIHNLDFSMLLNTMSQLDYNHLILLFEDLILGTSYDVETARNIFLEMVPHAKTVHCARFVKYLVIEKKEKIEDAAIIALIRKLPFNIANFNLTLLEELEVLTKLGLDFSPEIRRAGILSFATLVQKIQYYTNSQGTCCTNYLDYIVVKYFRMYSDCPQYIDRLTWLQGLCNIGHAAQAYTNVIYGDPTKDKHERLWAAFSSKPDGLYEVPFEVLKTNLPILTNETEHIQLRIIAIHNILSSTSITESDFLFLHNYIKNSTDEQLKNFWYSSVLSMRDYSKFRGYIIASSYVPFVINDVPTPTAAYWATSNHVISDGDASLQLFTVGDDSAMPAFAALRLSTGGMRPYHAALYILAQGVSADLYKELKGFDTEAMKIDELKSVLQKLTAWGRKLPEKVHIDIVVKVLDKTVYATHLNQTRKYFADAMFSALDFLRLGSHVNQQLIQVPTQMEVHIPSVLGIPIRLHTTSMSFASIRGNLSASENLLIRNDLHLRYQGIVLTSLSTDGPLLQSEHVARLQSSVVAHLPMKFNISVQLQDTRDLTSSIHSKRGGIAMHSRKEIAILTDDVLHVKTVGGQKRWDGATGYFSDCRLERSFVDLIDKLFGIKIKGDVRFLDPILKLGYFLKNMLLSTVPTTNSCGLVLPIQSREVEKVVTLRLKVTHQNYDELTLEVAPEIKFYKTGKSDEEAYLKSVSIADLKISKNQLNLTVLIDNKGRDMNDYDYPKDLKLNFSHQIDYKPWPDQDISTLPLPYNGTTLLTYSSETDRQTLLNVKFGFVPGNKSGVSEKSFRVDIIRDKKMPELLNSIFRVLSSLIPDAVMDRLMRIEKSDVFGPLKSFTIFTIKEKDTGLTSISNDKFETVFESPTPNIFQYIDSFTAVQRLKKIGLYKECRVQESIVNTLRGTVERAQPQRCAQGVLLADCTQVPKFAVLRLKNGGFRIHAGGRHVDLNDNATDHKHHVENSSNTTEYFDIQKSAEITRISLNMDIDVYRTRNELIILIPSVYMNSVCGECSGESVPMAC